MTSHHQTIATVFFLCLLFSIHQSHRVNETLPTSTNVTSMTLATKQPPVAVYTNIDSVRRHLTDPRFTCVDLREDADILWIYEHFKDFFNLSRSSRLQFVNQFPGEQVITVKDMLASVASLRTLTRVDDDHFCCVDEVDRKLTCHWYPVTFNLVYELPAFVAYFQKKQVCLSLIH
ncbi:unnamed protein product [Dicrocoelium dendriticum]|nr:unnamed protein product [Dicrocoelium dendriticum]